MKRSFVIILAIQFLLVLVFLVYAFIQKGFADDARMEALAQKEVADKNAEMALVAASEAKRQEAIAIQLKIEIDQLKSKCK